MPRLFVAVDLPEGVRAALSDLACGLPGARWVPEHQLHLTLAFLGEVDGGLAADARDALADVSQPSFEVALRGVGHFPPRGEPRIAWAGLAPSEPLARLHAAVERALSRAGCELERRKFHPHVTLARLSDTPSRRLADWLGQNGAFRTSPFPVASIVLYSSVLGSSGATHSVVAERPLS